MTQGGEVRLGENAFREIPFEQIRRLPAKLGLGLSIWAALVAVLVLLQVFMPSSKGTQYWLVVFLGLTLPLVFLYFNPYPRRRKAVLNQVEHQQTGYDTAMEEQQAVEAPTGVDWVLAALALLVALYPVLPLSGGYDAFLDRQGNLSTPDMLAGTALLLLILEATRRAAGLIGLMLPVVCLLFLGYSYYGGYLPQDWSIAHTGIDFDQIINGLYNDASGFYGPPMVAVASYIVMFNIYGGVLDASGASKFFVDLSHAAFRGSHTAPGRTAALSGFLLGTVSGSGSATTISIGAVTWPMLRRAGYSKENAGGLLAASGIGAMLSPPTLGAAAFIIAEYLNTSYFNVLIWAIIPTLLYYLGILLAVEASAKRFGTKPVYMDSPNPWRLLLRNGYHFISFAIIVTFLAIDNLSYVAVVYATTAAAVFTLILKLIGLRKAPANSGSGLAISVLRVVIDWVWSLVRAFAAGIIGTLAVVVVCAAAGVITSTAAKTGLGQVLSSSMVRTARAMTDNPTAILLLAVLFAVLAIGILGLAVPVNASFIISWTVLGPALIDLGVSPPQTAMFLFYYAVLSEVTPPTALAPLAASMVTGGDQHRTIWQTWKYAMPAFLVPIAFVLTDNGSALLWQRSLIDVLWVTAVSVIGVAALAVFTSGWIVGPTRWPERVLCAPAALLLLYLHPWTILAGIAFLVIALVMHLHIRPRLAMRKGGEMGISEPEIQEV
jgi:TRAP transporter 4TM/12TM fusion protein